MSKKLLKKPSGQKSRPIERDRQSKFVLTGRDFCPHGKKLPEALDQVQQAAPEATVDLWAFDEHRIGLKPILRRVWTFNGQRPTVVVEHRYQWLYV